MAETKRKDQTHLGSSRIGEMSEAEKDRISEKNRFFEFLKRPAAAARAAL
jgi:hypothetical protein